MADTTTTHYGFVLPEVGGSADTWGTKLNGNWSALDSLNGAAKTAANLSDLANAAAARANLGLDENEVVKTSLADLERQRQIEQTYNAAQATKAHAFGGTGSAILSAQTNDSYARNAAQSAAGLRSQGYNTALAAAQADAARRLQAEQGNQQAGNDLSMFNAGKTQDTNVFNAGQVNALAQFNAQQALDAARANQTAGLSGAQVNIDAARALSGLSDQERAHALEDNGLIAQVGDAQQAQTQRELDAALAAWQDGQALTLKQQELINAAISLLPNYGTTKSSGTASSKGTQSGFSFKTVTTNPFASGAPPVG